MSEINIAKLETWQALESAFLVSTDATSQTVEKLEEWRALFAPWLAAQTPPTQGGTLPLQRVAVHWIPNSNRILDHDYMIRLRPGAIKVVSLDPNRNKEALGYLDPASESVLVIRDHPLSEEKDAMMLDPVGTGKHHAASWRDKFKAGGRLADISPERVVVCGINEPFVQNEAQEKIVFAYTKAFLEDLTTYGLRGLALNLSVGWPRNSDTATVKNTKPIWDTFRPLEDIINAGPRQGHILGLHEYWRDDPDESWYTAPNGERWGWNAHRHWACPMSCRIIIGECGLTKEVAGLPAPGQSKGWIGNISAPAYAEQIVRYADKCHPNVLACMVFTTDGNQDWAMDDTAGAHADILARKHAYPWPSVWPVVKNVPPPIDPPEEDMQTVIVPKYSGNITGFYGQDYGYPHEGMDLSFVTGTEIVAPANGIVAWVDFAATSYGNYIRILCPKMMTCFFYGHLSEVFVRTGDHVTQGQVIGKTGSTGNSSGPHCHFECRAMEPGNESYTEFKPGQPLYRQNGRVDPLGWLTGWLAAGNKVIEQ